MTASDAKIDINLIYDGDCPFCTSYVGLIRLRSLYNLKLVNARDQSDVQQRLLGLGFNLDEGMVMELEGEYFHGTHCVQRIALLTTNSSMFNRINSWVFSKPQLAKVVYPVLVILRNLVLKMLGRTRING